jgi:Zn-finger nucleic acid-binding protein
MISCPNCGAPLELPDDEVAPVCPYCHQVYAPEENDEGVRVLGGASPLGCPVCSIPLVNAAMAQHRILYCGQCHGALITMGVFPSLIAELRARRRGGEIVPKPPDGRELQRHIRCPQCHHDMDTHYYGGPGNIVIDDCSRCDLDWLDSGELRTIVRAPDHSYNRESGGINDYQGSW